MFATRKGLPMKTRRKKPLRPRFPRETHEPLDELMEMAKTVLAIQSAEAVVLVEAYECNGCKKIEGSAVLAGVEGPRSAEALRALLRAMDNARAMILEDLAVLDAVPPQPQQN
jgi:hypothetical protein